MDMNIEMIKHFSTTLQNPSLIDAYGLINISSETLLPEFPTIYPYINNNLLSECKVNGGSLSSFPVKTLLGDQDYVSQENKKRKMMGQSWTTSENVSPTTSTTTSDFVKNVGKEKRSRKKEHEKSEEIIHVRAKRGQATDNHSLAERLRREKINQKLRCLQELVPGCNRTMGMVMILEEIINYVHSLQNQVEFLSMELGAASSSSNVQRTEAAESSMKLQGINRHEAHKVENWVRNQHMDWRT
ncbi:hypothetical protein ACFE04_006284 [Oxalis oulophora]